MVQLKHCCNQQCQRLFWVFVKLQLDESKDVFVAHMTSLGEQSLICRKNSCKTDPYWQFFLRRLFPRFWGILDRCTQQGILIAIVATMVNIDSLTTISKPCQEISLTVSSCHAQITATHHTLTWSRGVYHIRRCNLTVLNKRCKWSFKPCRSFTQHITLWPRSHSIWWARTEPSETY